MNVVLDANSFASIVGSSTTTGADLGAGVAMPVGGVGGLMLATGSSTVVATTYSSAALRDIETLYRYNAYNNLIEREGPARGKMVCRLIDGNASFGAGFTILSGLTLCTINLLGIPFGSYSTKMLVQVDIYDENENHVAQYTSSLNKSKKWFAMYWGYSDAERVAHCTAFKKCMEEINNQIRYDYKNLVAKLNGTTISQQPVVQPKKVENAPVQNMSTTTETDVNQQLAKLKRWLEMGVITQEEYASQRKKLIGF